MDPEVTIRGTGTVRGTAIKMGATIPDVYRWIWEGKLQARKLNGVWRIESSSISKLMAARQKRRELAMTRSAAKVQSAKPEPGPEAA
jgi:predicted site-specific integrase-resolvase